MHDLRFVIDGEVTQIDHLILNQMVSVFLLETRNYACNLVINERGKFTATASAPPAEPAKRLVCAQCDVKISFAEGKFCRNNAQRFGRLAYCREHQALM